MTHKEFITALFHDEINAFLKEQFYESWMDEDDWVMFLDELQKQSGISIKSLSKDLELGLKNGHSIEKQFELVRVALKNKIYKKEIMTSKENTDY